MRLPFAERVCLVLITQEVSHGWALGSMLAPDGELGRIWTLSRPLTYRAIDGLVDKGLITRTGQAAGRGRDRVLLAPTAPAAESPGSGSRSPSSTCATSARSCWSSCSSGTGPASTTSRCWPRQAELFEPAIDALTSTHRDDDLVDLWRRESARAVRRFLDQALHPSGPAAPRRPELRISARNQLHGTVTGVHHGEVMATIDAVLGDGQPLTAAITKDASTDLDLAPGDPVMVIIKSTEVIVATGVGPGVERR